MMILKKYKRKLINKNQIQKANKKKLNAKITIKALQTPKMKINLMFQHYQLKISLKILFQKNNTAYFNQCSSEKN